MMRNIFLKKALIAVSTDKELVWYECHIVKRTYKYNTLKPDGDISETTQSERK